MPAKLTEEQALRRIAARLEGSCFGFIGFKGGAYINARGRLLIECREHGVFDISYDKFVSGTGCRRCADSRLSAAKITPECEIVKDLISSCQAQGFTFKGFEGGVFRSVDGRAAVECPEHGSFFRRIADLKSRAYKCPLCSYEGIRLKNRMSEAEARSRWEKSCASKNITFLGFDGEYSSADTTKALVECQQHGVWKAGYSSFVLMGTGCASCNRQGFKSLDVAYLYALSSGCHVKIGVTNNPRVRISRLKTQTPFPFELVELIKFNTGINAMTAERYFHDKYESSGFSGFDGATEWLKFDSRILEEMRAF